MTHRTVPCASFTVLTALACMQTQTAWAQPEAVAQHSESVADEAPDDKALTFEWNGSLGGSHNAGNTEQFAVNFGTDFELTTAPHVLYADFKFAYGMNNPQDDTPDAGLRRNVENINAKLRYDYFLTEMDALFAAVVYRSDVFAALDHRLQGQAGYLRNFFKQESHRFWGEIGYDFTFDDTALQPYTMPDPLVVIPDTITQHSARLFLGYSNKLNPYLTYVGGVEGLINLGSVDGQTTMDAAGNSVQATVQSGEGVRINWDNALRSDIVGNLKLEVSFNLKFDNGAEVLRGAQKIDTQTVFSLLYSLTSPTPPPPEG